MVKASKSRRSTFNSEPSNLGKEIMVVSEIKNRSVHDLRERMSCDDRKKRKLFEAEARRQSSLIVNSPEEERVMDWIKHVNSTHSNEAETGDARKGWSKS